MMEPKIIHKLEPVIQEVKKKTGINIQNFKPAFLERRIQYRMRNVGISNYEEYVQLLSSSFEETKALYAAFSINVTKFFRDPQVWKKLEEDIVPELSTSMRFSPIRAWSCGSASGEEPHSISIMLNDIMKNKKRYQVYATDINEDAISHSKKGLYKKENMIHVSSERVEKYFEKTPEGNFQVHPQIGNNIQYDRIDMMKTSEKLFNIIFCRNVLIYYDKDAHERIFKKFYNALKKDGIFVLGQDESMIGTTGSEYFDLIHPKERIYKKKAL